MAPANDLQNFIHVQIVQVPVEEHFAPVLGLQFRDGVGAAGGFFHFRRFVFRFADP